MRLTIGTVHRCCIIYRVYNTFTEFDSVLRGENFRKAKMIKDGFVRSVLVLYIACGYSSFSS